MHKKLMLACAATAAFAAFAVVPTAQAAVLTDKGSVTAVGSSVTAKNVGVTMFTGGWGLGCAKVHLQGTVTQNSGSTVKVEIPVGGATFSSEGGGPCESDIGFVTVKVTSKLCMEIMSGDQLFVTGCGSPVTFDLTAFGLTCKYEATSFSGTFSTNTTPAPVTVFQQGAVEEFPGSAFCPDKGEIDLTVALYTTGGTTGLTLS